MNPPALVFDAYGPLFDAGLLADAGAGWRRTAVDRDGNMFVSDSDNGG